MEPEILFGVDEDVEHFLEGEEPTDSSGKRPLWPNVPTPCPVPTCAGHDYASFPSFLRHWDNKHKANIILFLCPCCSFKSPRGFNVRRHVETRHKLKVTSELQITSVVNSKFTDPAGILPFQFDHKTRMSEKRKRTNVVGDILVRGGEVCRDQEASEVENGSVVVTFKKKRTQ
jgi:hypothetical protein